MASVLIALSAAVVFTTEKIRKRKQKKRELKAHQVDEITTVDKTVPPQYDEDLLAYKKEGLPAYAIKDQHPAHRNDKHGYASHSRNPQDLSGMRS
ncbi:hypothetical protein E2P81_ATG01864 [Venturia nashicola]|uniref:Uncharacterized protein n=1 Tax=Venturia nashicola TaxID=86259 RepID=A0A4Z1PL09_9PEZI|nr:hypothetical protein E6O75_ATG01908 [Venturia nashicola]TLD35561.1 hypothetical protein E2P81_ATG01864 [Venturia nashicola]